MKSFALLLPLALCAQTAEPLRPPATPLIAHDPYFSIWLMGDEPGNASTKHWTGTDHPLTGLVRVDGKPYRFLGSQPRNTPVLRLKSRTVTPLQTKLIFEGAGIRLTTTFFTPAFLDDLDVLSRPATYLLFEVLSIDRVPHRVEMWFDAAATLAVNTPDQAVSTSRLVGGGLEIVRAGSQQQSVLGKYGDNLRIDWGWFYLAAQEIPVFATNRTARDTFAREGKAPVADDFDTPRPAGDRNPPLLAAAIPFGLMGSDPAVRMLVLAYDDLYSIQYLQRNLRPWWRRNGDGPLDLLQKAFNESKKLFDRAEQRDKELISRFTEAGGAKYAEIATLAYRQAIAAHKLVADIDGTPLYFSKENFSNGCIATVDVTYPSAPLFLRLQPRLLRGMLVPILQYASLPRWRWPFAPHDLGTYPLANGQVYGGGERTEENQMPVEESGNMLILMAALADAERDPSLAKQYWPLLTKWAQYLREKGLDPENQLSTDDFAGHLAHNTNLSLKAILALGAYAQLAEKIGEPATAKQWMAEARRMAGEWEKMARDGDHYKLAFDKPGTWSQKYNLVWDQLLALNLFPPDIARREIAFYKKNQQKYGLPLDNRRTYTKLDWIIWTATLAENRADFEALVEPVWRFLNESPSRVPMTDWYETTDGKMVGFQARSVVGGVFIPMLKK